MKFLTFVTALSLTCSSVHSHPLRDNAEVHHAEDLPHLEARQTTRQPEVYLTAGRNNNVRPRLELRQLKAQQPNQYAILMIALRRWMQRSSRDQSSYFAISGIHGVPREPYNNYAQCASCGGADGYCTHDSVHFPAWHRAYIALFEQELLKVARQVANEYPANTRATFQRAANDLRWPFIDWAARPPGTTSVLPLIITDATVTVQGPTGRTTFENPLLQYNFKGDENSRLFYGQFRTWPRTHRYPNSNSRDARSNQDAAVQAVRNFRQSMQDQVYQLFTQCRSYLYFSNNDARASSARCANSVEAIHNNFHNAVGGGGSQTVMGGHMTYLPVSSFDPVFWLHHTNVDRLFAMWQGINPNLYGATQTAAHSTWTIRQGLSQGPSSCLTPFMDPNRRCYTANSVREWRNFGYDYPEFSNSNRSPQAITGYVNRLYGRNPTATAGSSKREAAPQVGEQVSKVLGDIEAGNPLKASNGSLYEYVANIKTQRYALGGSYTIFLFNGKPASEEPSTWPSAQNLFGPVGIVAMDGMEDLNVTITASVPLTRKLTEAVENNSNLLGSLSELLVAPFLTKNLEWRVAKDGASVDPTSIPDFSVSVYTSSAQPPSDPDSFPVYSEFIPLLDVTKGHAGGANTTQFIVEKA